MFEGSRLRALVFDLDGTLVETEHLKARAYAELIRRLTGKPSDATAAIDLYRSIVGATDMVVCDAMIERFGLEHFLDLSPGETARQALHRERMELYRRNFGTPEQLRKLVYDHNVQLMRAARRAGLDIAVATMSFSDEALRVVDAIGLSEYVRTIVGVDHVAHPKPAPDAFLEAMKRLDVEPSSTLIVEDSPRGAAAAATSGASWICVATEFSQQALRAQDEVDHEWIVWEPSQLRATVERRIGIAD